MFDLIEIIKNNNNYNEILNVGAMFSGTVLAVFFTLISLPLQNILSRYSQDLIKRVWRDPIFITSFIFLGTTFIYNLALLTFGASPDLVMISFGLGIISVLTLFLLVFHTFFLLDVRNQITETTSRIRRKIKKKIVESEKKRDKEYLKFKELIKNHENNLSTDLRKVYIKFSVDDSVTSWLRSETEIVIDITQRAIQDNRFEVVRSALRDIVGLAEEYIQARLEYNSEQDKFITYLHEKLIDMKNLARKDTHPEIILSIATTAKDIAVATLSICPIRSSAGENYMPLGFINLLKNICLSEEILKETSYAPMMTISYLVDIGKAAVDKEFPRTANLISDALGEISRTTTKLHSYFTDVISAKANWGLAALLDYMLFNQDKIRINREFALKEIVNEINKSIKTYFEDDERYQYSLRANIKTFFGPLSTEEHGVATIFIRSLQIKRKNEKEYWYLLEVLEKFLIELNQNIMMGMDHRKYIDIKEMLEHLYMIGVVLTGFIERVKEENIKSKALKILREHFSYPFINAISMSFKRDDKYNIFYDDYIDTFFSLIGVIFFKNNKNEFNETIEDWTTKIIEIIQRHKQNIFIIHDGEKFLKYEIIHPLSDLYKHLRLLGVWFVKYSPKSKFLSSIIKEFKNQPPELVPKAPFGEDVRYPKSLLGETWAVRRPYLPFNPSYFDKIDKALCEQKAIEEFEKKLQKGK